MEFPRERFEVLFAGPDNDEALRHMVESESTNAKIDLKYIEEGVAFVQLAGACAGC